MAAWLRGPRAFAVAGGLAAIVAIALIAASLATSAPESPAPAPAAETIDGSGTTALLKGIPQRENVLGNAAAPVTLVEYADLQCPYCAEWSHTALPELVRDYVRPGRLRIEFRGLAFIGPDSESGLRAALAAGRQGKLWNVVDLLYHNQGHENSGWLTEDLLRSVGGAVPGLQTERMLRERTGRRVSDGLAAAQASATAAGVHGTPAFEVGRTGGKLQRVNVSSLDAGALRPAIESALAAR